MLPCHRGKWGKPGPPGIAIPSKETSPWEGESSRNLPEIGLRGGSEIASAASALCTLDISNPTFCGNMWEVSVFFFCETNFPWVFLFSVSTFIQIHDIETNITYRWILWSSIWIPIDHHWIWMNYNWIHDIDDFPSISQLLSSSKWGDSSPRVQVAEALPTESQRWLATTGLKPRCGDQWGWCVAWYKDSQRSGDLPGFTMSILWNYV